MDEPVIDGPGRTHLCVMMLVVAPMARGSDPSGRFEAVFRAHYAAVDGYVRRVWPSVDGDDVVSQTFEIAFRRFDAIPPDTTRGWLIAVAKNCALNAVRSHRRRRHYLEAFAASRARRSADLHDESVALDTSDALATAFAALRDTDQEVLLLAAWDELSGDDLGAALGTSAGTAAVRLHRARQRLHEHYDRLGGGA